MSDLVEIARIIGPHGLKGSIKIIPYCESFESFSNYSHLMVGDNGIPREVTGALDRGTFYIITLDGISDISLVEPLKGQTLYVRRDQLHETAQDEYYWRDIIGLKVMDTHGKTLGEVVDIFKTGSNDVYVVDHEREYFIPATRDVIKEISIENGRMIIDATLMEGLLD
jgi:16S rRNA processing protein RimM